MTRLPVHLTPEQIYLIYPYNDSPGPRHPRPDRHHRPPRPWALLLALAVLAVGIAMIWWLG